MKLISKVVIVICITEIFIAVSLDTMPPLNKSIAKSQSGSNPQAQAQARQSGASLRPNAGNARQAAQPNIQPQPGAAAQAPGQGNQPITPNAPAKSIEQNPKPRRPRPIPKIIQNQLCKSGRSQSPIKFETQKIPLKTNVLSLMYKDGIKGKPKKMKNGTIGFFVKDNQLRAKFTETLEHRFKGQVFEYTLEEVIFLIGPGHQGLKEKSVLEMILIHRSQEQNPTSNYVYNTLNIAIPIKMSQDTNLVNNNVKSPQKQIENSVQNMKKSAFEKFTLSGNSYFTTLPQIINESGYYVYHGSQIDQSCSENVNWIVVSNPVPMSKEGIDGLMEVNRQPYTNNPDEDKRLENGSPLRTDWNIAKKENSRIIGEYSPR